MPENMSQSDLDMSRGVGWVVAQGTIFAFFLMAVVSEDPLALDGEMERMYWCPIEQAATRLTFETERCVVDQARDHIGGSARD